MLRYTCGVTRPPSRHKRSCWPPSQPTNALQRMLHSKGRQPELVRRSRMPLIGLVRLQRALGVKFPFRLNPWPKAQDWATTKRARRQRLCSTWQQRNGRRLSPSLTPRWPQAKAGGHLLDVWASEGAEMRQGREGKPGSTGTIRRVGRCTAQARKPSPTREGSRGRDAMDSREALKFPASTREFLESFSWETRKG